jgi:hypothetical protein
MAAGNRGARRNPEKASYLTVGRFACPFIPEIGILSEIDVREFS